MVVPTQLHVIVELESNRLRIGDQIIFMNVIVGGGHIVGGGRIAIAVDVFVAVVAAVVVAVVVVCVVGVRRSKESMSGIFVRVQDIPAGVKLRMETEKPK